MNVKNFFSLIWVILLATATTQAQQWSSPELEQMYQQGLATLGRGNANEAIAIFQKIAPIEPNNFLVKKSLAQAYQVAGNSKNTIIILEPLLADGTADADCYRLAGQAYAGIKEDKKALKILQQGIDKNPQSGLLYYELGMQYKQQKNYENALKAWLDGIAADPNYHLNYHEAAIAYVQTDNVLWAIIYGEIFVNKEPLTKRGNDTRILLLDAYQKLFFTPSKNVIGDQSLVNTPTNFEEAAKKTLLSLFFVVSDGITTENLIMLRSRFIISWQNTFAQQYPFALFAYHDELMRNGHFDTYNQWLLGKAESPQHYTTYTTTFANELRNFETYRAKYPLRLTATDLYNSNRNFKGWFDTKTNKAAKR